MAVKSVPPLERTRIYTDSDMAASESFALGGGVAAIYCARSPDKRENNEDSAALIPFPSDSAVLVVADGAGGCPAGQHASGIAVDRINTALRQAARDGAGLREGILNGIENASEAVNALGVGAGTTLAVAEVQGEVVRPYHVGDSKVLVIGQRGRIKLETLSHAPVDYAVEAGYLDAGDALHHEERHLVTNMIGSPGMRIEVGPAHRLAPRDTLLLASDGLFDNLHLDEIVDLVRAGPLRTAVHRLRDACHARMHDARPGHPSKPDDLTIITFRRTPR